MQHRLDQNQHLLNYYSVPKLENKEEMRFFLTSILQPSHKNERKSDCGFHWISQGWKQEHPGELVPLSKVPFLKEQFIPKLTQKGRDSPHVEASSNLSKTRERQRAVKVIRRTHLLVTGGFTHTLLNSEAGVWGGERVIRSL